MIKFEGATRLSGKTMPGMVVDIVPASAQGCVSVRQVPSEFVVTATVSVYHREKNRALRRSSTTEKTPIDVEWEVLSIPIYCSFPTKHAKASGWHSNRTSHIMVGVVIAFEKEGSLPFTTDYRSEDESRMHGMNRGTHYLGVTL
jgi:hypothetical protein